MNLPDTMETATCENFCFSHSSYIHFYGAFVEFQASRSGCGPVICDTKEAKELVEKLQQWIAGRENGETERENNKI